MSSQNVKYIQHSTFEATLNTKEKVARYPCQMLTVNFLENFKAANYGDTLKEMLDAFQNGLQYVLINIFPEFVCRFFLQIWLLSTINTVKGFIFHQETSDLESATGEINNYNYYNNNINSSNANGMQMYWPTAFGY